MSIHLSRREAARIIGGATAALLVAPTGSAQEKTSLLQRAIPSSGEKLPVIGLGTSRVFDVGASAAERAPLKEVLRSFVQLGGRLVDSSPMYGQAERVVGESAAELGLRDSLFLATKVWTSGRDAGIKSMETSLRLLEAKKLDLLQVHNLVDVQTQLATLRLWKKEGRARYLGVTHYTEARQDDVARVLKNEPLDFVQINYSVMERAAAERVFPVAQERGVAVIVNRPFGAGGLFGRVRGKTLPEWAAEIDCQTWAQFFLKWIVAHPAVTCVIPATSKAAHLADNMQGGTGRLPDEKMRARMVALVESF